jgi:hypothetical protein
MLMKRLSFIALFLLAVIGYSILRRNSIYTKLKKDGVISSSIYKSCYRSPQGGSMRLKYRIKVDSKYYDGSEIYEKDNILASGTKVGILIDKGFSFNVIYSKSNPQVNMILLKASSHKYFNQPYSDSLKYFCEELGLEDCSNSNVSEAEPWWENFF